MLANWETQVHNTDQKIVLHSPVVVPKLGKKNKQGNLEENRETFVWISTVRLLAQHIRHEPTENTVKLKTNSQQSNTVMAICLMQEGCIISKMNSDCATLKKKSHSGS